MSMTFLDVFRAASAEGSTPSPEMFDLLEAAGAIEREGWNEVAAQAQFATDESGEYHRGRAHALCDLLGDQENLWSLVTVRWPIEYQAAKDRHAAA